MYCQWVILLLIIFTENKLATAGTNNTESCGKLSSDPKPVKAGNNATLVYVPDKNYVNSSRKWTRLSSDSTKDVLVFDSANTSSRSAKYIESSLLNGYTLFIQEVTLDDAGAYVVTCSNQPTYSNPFNLTITEECGSMSIAPVNHGSDATLVYTPSTKYFNSTRQWRRSSKTDNTTAVVYDSGDNATWSTEYYEVFTGKGYNLTIKEADFNDGGLYEVMCSQNPLVYSFQKLLNVYPNPPNTTAANELTTYLTTKAMSTSGAKDETLKPSTDNERNHMSKEPAKSTFITTDKPADTTAKFDTTMITVHDVTSQSHTASEDPFSTTRLSVTNDKNEITYRTTNASRNTSGEDEQLTPSSKSTQTYTSTGHADTTFKTKANELTTYLTTKAMSTTSAKDEKVKPSTDNERNHTSLEPAKTTFKTTVTPRNQKNDDVSTKGKPEDTTTQKVHRVTTTITSDEKSRNIDQVTPRNQEHNGEPTTRKPEDTTTQKAHGGTSEGASDEKHRNNEQSSNSTAITVTVIVFILVAIAIVVIVVKVMDRKKRKQKIPKGSQEKAHYSRNNDMTGNFQTLEIPEYAQVTPKEQRTIEVKQGTSEKTIPRINNTETNNQLVYAELDLQPLGTFSTFKQSADQNKATEYVSVDFTKMGTIQENEGTPEKNEATDHVSLDLTKNGTIQGNENTQEKNVATEHVSLDLTKTGIIQVNENTPENNATTENLSVDFTKTSTIQENEGTPEKNEATAHVSVDFTTTGTIQRNENTPENNGATENVSISHTKTGTSQENELSPEK